MLPLAVHGMPHDAAVCVFHAQTMIQLPDDAKVRLASSLADLSSGRRSIYWVSLEVNGVVMAASRTPSPETGWDGSAFTVLGLVRDTNRGWTERVLALCDPHGRWVEWIGPGL